MNAPFIHLLGPASVQVADNYIAGQGMLYSAKLGFHAIWGARVPFIPALDNQELGAGGSRIGKVVGRHFRFLYDLARVQQFRSTYELRFISHPAHAPQRIGRVDIVFLGKVFVENRSDAKRHSEELWRKFLSNYPLEDPFNYPITPIFDADDFLRVYEPIQFSQLSAEHLNAIAEIRRYEEQPIVVPGQPLAQSNEYIIHPFVPTLDYSAMGRLLETLAIQENPCFASISIRPTILADIEIHNFSNMARMFRQLTEDAQTEKNNSALERGEYRVVRARKGAQFYSQLMLEREFLMQVKVQIVGYPEAPTDLIEALGSEMMNNGRNDFPTKWVKAVPDTVEDFEVAKTNLVEMEHEDWGPVVAANDLRRLRSIADVQQAAGAFRLPIPPESGYMPGVRVRSEPFVSPQDILEEDTYDGEGKTEINLGQVYHRGSPNGEYMSIEADILTRHALIAGSTGSGKSTTISSILAQLSQMPKPVPFLVLYPLDKPDYRELLTIPTMRDKLLIFTVGDDNVSPFRFNPFAVPDGVLIKTHISRLMRVFSSTFDLFAPLPMIYREALRTIYRESGWDIMSDYGDRNASYPTLADFHRSISEISDTLNYEGEARASIQQASVIRIADLLENTGNLLNVEKNQDFQQLLGLPIVMELGRIGSQEDISLVMGFLLTLLVETIEKRKPKSPHIMVVEEAHRLMSERQVGESQSNSAEDFSNILAEIRGHNAGMIIAEQIPALLVRGAIGNTYLKIMHWLEDKESHDLFSGIMNLNEQQMSYTRRLKPGEAIVRSKFGKPVHIRVDPTIGISDTSALTSDQNLAVLMKTRLQEIGLTFPESLNNRTSLASEASRRPKAGNNIYDVITGAPLTFQCAYCRPYLRDRKCLHQHQILDPKHKDELSVLEHELLSLLKYDVLTYEQTLYFMRQVEKIVGESESDSLGYCFLAHVSQKITNSSFNDKFRKTSLQSLKSYPWPKQ